MDGWRAGAWLRSAFDPGAADQAETRCLDPDPRGNHDPGPSHQRHLGQGDLGRGQLGLAQVQPGAADDADHDDVGVHPPRPADPQAADRRDVPGGRGGSRSGGGPCGGPGRGGIRGKVGDKAVEFGPGAGRGGQFHPLAELLQGQPPVPGGRAEALDGRVTLGVRGPDACGWLVVARGSAHRCLRLPHPVASCRTLSRPCRTLPCPVASCPPATTIAVRG